MELADKLAKKREMEADSGGESDGSHTDGASLQ